MGATGAIHIVGAGLAGLAAAVQASKAGRPVVLHESTSHAGGRCRSYHDASLGMRIDNGNHIILSGNREALDYLDEIGARDKVSGPQTARFAFHDLATGESWKLDLGDGRLPMWILRTGTRVPGTRLRDYFALVPLSIRPGRGTVAQAIACPETLYRRMLQPMLLATLNNDPLASSARLAAAVLRETVARGGRCCRPLIAHAGLGAAFVDPAVRLLKQRGTEIRFSRKLRSVDVGEGKVRALGFAGETIELDDADSVVLAVPPDVAARLLPDIETPDVFRSIANIHFALDESLPLPPMIGVVNASAQWVFQYPGRLSVTISNSEGPDATDRENLARRIWSEIIALTGEERPMPRWQVIHERRATFACLPSQEERRPSAGTGLANLFLAGDWTATGLPPTIEGAIRSGRRAARLATSGGM